MFAQVICERGKTPSRPAGPTMPHQVPALPRLTLPCLACLDYLLDLTYLASSSFTCFVFHLLLLSLFRLLTYISSFLFLSVSAALNSFVPPFFFASSSSFYSSSFFCFFLILLLPLSLPSPSFLLCLFFTFSHF